MPPADTIEDVTCCICGRHASGTGTSLSQVGWRSHRFNFGALDVTFYCPGCIAPPDDEAR